MDLVIDWEAFTLATSTRMENYDEPVGKHVLIAKAMVDKLSQLESSWMSEFRDMSLLQEPQDAASVH